jgi:hypothetical protein
MLLLFIEEMPSRYFRQSGRRVKVSTTVWEGRSTFPVPALSIAGECEPESDPRHINGARGSFYQHVD